MTSEGARPSAIFRRTLTDTDLVLCAGLIGDSHPVHLDASSPEAIAAGGRTIHAMLLLGFASTAASLLFRQEELRTRVAGFRDVTFSKSAHPGDTVTATASLADADMDGTVEVGISVTAESGDELVRGVLVAQQV